MNVWIQRKGCLKKNNWFVTLHINNLRTKLLALLLLAHENVFRIVGIRAYDGTVTLSFFLITA